MFLYKRLLGTGNFLFKTSHIQYQITIETRNAFRWTTGQHMWHKPYKKLLTLKLSQVKLVGKDQLELECFCCLFFYTTNRKPLCQVSGLLLGFYSPHLTPCWQSIKQSQVSKWNRCYEVPKKNTSVAVILGLIWTTLSPASPFLKSHLRRRVYFSVPRVYSQPATERLYCSLFKSNCPQLFIT